MSTTSCARPLPERLQAPGVEGLALLVHHVVVVEQVLADVEVARLDLLLGVLDHAGEHAVLDRLALLDAHPIPPLGDAIGLEDAQQVVLEGQEELARAGIALAAGAAAQLVVDAPALVALGAEDVQAAGLHHTSRARPAHGLELRQHGRVVLVLLVVAARASAIISGLPPEHDVGAAARHVGRDGDRALAARLGDDLGLALVLLGVQHVVLDALLLELLGEHLRGLDRDRAHQHGLPGLVALLDLVDRRR